MNIPPLDFTWNFIGNNKVLNFLERVIAQNRLSHAYIVSGPEHIGKTTLVERLLQVLFCDTRKRLADDSELSSIPCGTCIHCREIMKGVHPDIAFLGRAFDEKNEKLKKNISIEQIRAFQSSLITSAFLDSYRVGVIREAELLSEEASNGLLKALEEAKRGTIFILITKSEQYLLPTLVSRCQLLRLNHVSESEIYDGLLHAMQQENRDKALLYAKLSCGLPGIALSFACDPKLVSAYQDEVRSFLLSLQNDAVGRLIKVNEVCKGAHGGNAAELLLAKMQIWLMTLRDLLFIKTMDNQDALLLNAWYREGLFSVSQHIAAPVILQLMERLQSMPRYLSSHMQPRALLDEFFLSFS